MVIQRQKKNHLEKTIVEGRTVQEPDHCSTNLTRSKVKGKAGARKKKKTRK